MHRLIPILSIIALGFPNSTFPRDKLDITEMKGGSVMTDQLSGQRFDKALKWFVINDPSCPVRLERTGVTTSQNEQYYASRGILTAQQRLIQVEVHFMLFDGRGNYIKTLSRTETADLAPGASLLLDKLGPWKTE